VGLKAKGVASAALPAIITASSKGRGLTRIASTMLIATTWRQRHNVRLSLVPDQRRYDRDQHGKGDHLRFSEIGRRSFMSP
jgi:hypothetical protein